MLEIGKKYGKLTVIKQVDSYKTIGKRNKQSFHKRFELLCDCGHIRIAGHRILKLKEPCCTKCSFEKRPQSLKVNDLYIRPYKLLYSSSKTRNIDCSLTLEYFKKLVIKECYYCGEEPKEKKWNGSKIFIANGIDRINNDLGYHEDNCVSCCSFCNFAKNQFTQENFFKKVEEIYNKHIKFNINDVKQNTKTNL